MPSNTVPGPATGPPTTVAVPTITTYLQKGDMGTTEIWTTYAEVKSIDGPSMSNTWHDTTSHSNPDKFRRGIVVLNDVGDINFELNFIPTHATHNYATGMLGDYVNGALIHLRMAWPDNILIASRTNYAFYGYFIKFNFGAPVDGVATAKVSFKATGPPAFSA